MCILAIVMIITILIIIEIPNYKYSVLEYLIPKRPPRKKILKKRA